MSYGLIFDVDGVLGDTETIIALASIDMFKELYGAELIPEDFRPYIGTGAVRYVVGPAEDKGITINVDEAIDVRFKHFVRYMAETDISFPGANALIDAAYAAPEWTLAIATSSPEEKSRATLRAAKVDVEKFAVYTTGDHVTHKKPHPEIYLATAEALGIAPERCVVVEDAITGVTSAKAAGMKVIGITNSFSAEELSASDHIVSSLEEVDMALLERLAGNGAAG